MNVSFLLPFFTMDCCERFIVKHLFIIAHGEERQGVDEVLYHTVSPIGLSLRVMYVTDVVRKVGRIFCHVSSCPDRTFSERPLDPGLPHEQ